MVVEMATQRTEKIPEIKNMHEVWKTLDRTEGDLDEGSIANNLVYFSHFIRFMTSNYRTITDIRLLNVRMTKEWAGQLKKDGYLGKTFNNYVAGLSAMFGVVALDLGLVNPFGSIKRASLKGVTAHRKPFTLEEVISIYGACATDMVVGPIIILALNTGMRRADCALLKWVDVNLAEGFINVTAQKTDEKMDMPILTKLREVLEKQPRAGEYVFPEIAGLFNSKTNNTNHITLRLKKILKVAGIDYDERNDEFISPIKRLRKASISGMHAMKTTFVTIALDAGVPVSTVKKIVGNQVVEIVLKNYYRPAREQIANKMRTLLPTELTGEKAKDSLRGLLMKMEESNWREVRVQLLKMVTSGR